MKYLKNFNQQLRKLRDNNRLSCADIGHICSVDQSVVEAWEQSFDTQRVYPTIDNLLDLCVKTGTDLEFFIDLEAIDKGPQMDLPGFALMENNDLDDSLEKLSEEIDQLILTEDEAELLRRYRRSDEQSKELILQLIAN